MRNPGPVIDVADLVYKPPRDGPTLWEIGYPDRTAAEFYVPDANPMYINKLYVNQDRFAFSSLTPEALFFRNLPFSRLFLL